MEAVTSSKSPVSYQSDSVTSSVSNEANSSGVSWSAVIVGAFVTAALALILLALGTGVGLSSVSLWSNTGLSASTISKAAIVWLIVMQVISLAMGGYLAGRLRTKWANIHTDEVYFRDTAHGFLAWAVAQRPRSGAPAQRGLRLFTLTRIWASLAWRYLGATAPCLSMSKIPMLGNSSSTSRPGSGA
jgi:hypothetical protein